MEQEDSEMQYFNVWVSRAKRPFTNGMEPDRWSGQMRNAYMAVGQITILNEGDEARAVGDDGTEVYRATWFENKPYQPYLRWEKVKNEDRVWGTVVETCVLTERDGTSYALTPFEIDQIEWHARKGLASRLTGWAADGALKDVKPGESVTADCPLVDSLVEDIGRHMTVFPDGDIAVEVEIGKHHTTHGNPILIACAFKTQFDLRALQ